MNKNFIWIMLFLLSIGNTAFGMHTKKKVERKFAELTQDENKSNEFTQNIDNEDPEIFGNMKLDDHKNTSSKTGSKLLKIIEKNNKLKLSTELANHELQKIFVRRPVVLTRPVKILINNGMESKYIYSRNSYQNIATSPCHPCQIFSPRMVSCILDMAFLQYHQRLQIYTSDSCRIPTSCHHATCV